MTVYVVQRAIPNKHGWVPNLEPATKYGKLDYIFPADLFVSSQTNRAIDIAYQKMEQFEPESDYLCWSYSGDPIALSIVMLVLGNTGHEFIRFLRWNRKRDKDGVVIPNVGYYEPVDINLSNIRRKYYGNQDEL